MSEASSDDGSPRVLIVDDEPDLAEMYAEFLDGEADVSIANDGETALSMVDDDVDVVFLDREMPGMPGDEVLAAIREEGYDCYVAMLTAVEPDIDVFDMPFDEYVVKPVSKKDLQRKLRQLLQRSAFGEEMRELFAKTSKRKAIADDDPGDTWSRKEISTIVDEADVAPAPGVFGGWKGGYMAMREEREREFTSEADRSPLPVVFERVAAAREDEVAQGFRLDAKPRSVAPIIGDVDDDIVALSNGQVRDVVRTLALGFDELGVSSDAPVLLASGPRPEAAWCDVAVLAAGGIVVGVDGEAGPDRVDETIAATRAVGAVVETAETLRSWDETLADRDLAFVIVLDELDDETNYISPAASLGTLYREADRATEERRYGELLERIAPESPAGLVVDERTAPLILTHRNLVENAAQLYARFAANETGPVSLGPGDRILTAVPATHVYGRVLNHYLRLMHGGTTVYAGPGTVRADAERVGPALVAVPSDLVGDLADWVVEAVADDALLATPDLLDVAAGVGADHRHVDEPGPDDRALEWVTDRVGLATFRERLGDPDAIAFGPRPIDEVTHDRFYGAGVVPVPCYAPDRAGVVLAAGPPEDPRPGTLGVPLYDEEIEVKWTPSVPADEDREIGELAVGGPNVPAATWGGAAASDPFAEDGLLKTGEIVEWTEEDFLVRRS